MPIAYFDSDYEIYRSMPRKVDDYHSMPYTKRFGYTSEEAAEIPFTDEWKERGGITPDEYMGDTFIRVLTGRE